MSRRLLAFLASALGLALSGASSAPDYERPPVDYSAASPRDAVARLQAQLASGEQVLEGTEREVLGRVLALLDVPEWSQVAVFSRTSLQRGLIRPERPRVLYFSDSVYLGWVPGGLIELAAVDPDLGPIFYSLDTRPHRRAKARVERDADCLRCHGGSFVRDIPGLLARSVFPDSTGEALLRHGSLLVDDSTPFSERWGGWYVTGYSGTEPHRGNVLASETGAELRFAPALARPLELSAYFDVSDYLRPTSDVVALLLLEHQMAVQNSLTRAVLSARRMIAYQHGLQQAFGEAPTDEPTYDSVHSVFAGAVEDVLDHLLFRDAAPLPAGLDGNAELRAEFARGAPRTRAGLSLKDLDLHGRLLAHRCSYLIYSDAFTGLPPPLKRRILERLHSVLSGGDGAERYAHIPAEERHRILAILKETHPDARRQWTQG
jgi:hypothetical protein